MSTNIGVNRSAILINVSSQENFLLFWQLHMCINCLCSNLTPPWLITTYCMDCKAWIVSKWWKDRLISYIWGFWCLRNWSLYNIESRGVYNVYFIVCGFGHTLCTRVVQKVMRKDLSIDIIPYKFGTLLQSYSWLFNVCREILTEIQLCSRV